jgi:sulfur carrier protein ThiS
MQLSVIKETPVREVQIERDDDDEVITFRDVLDKLELPETLFFGIIGKKRVNLDEEVNEDELIIVPALAGGN